MRMILDNTVLRRLSSDDLNAFQAYRRDPKVARYQSWEDMDDERASRFLNCVATCDPLLQPDQWTQIAVADAETDALLGDMGLHLSKNSSQAEIGITLARSAQGQGHATRAVTLATELLFSETPITRIRAWADIRNTPSRDLMIRCGFTETGIEVTNGVKEAAFQLLRAPA